MKATADVEALVGAMMARDPRSNELTEHERDVARLVLTGAAEGAIAMLQRLRSDVAIAAAIRAVYDAWPTCKKVDGRRVPMSYEESYGHAPEDHADDMAEMRVAIDAALKAAMP